MLTDSVTRAPLRGLPLAEQTLPSLLRRQAAAFADKTLLTSTGGERRSYLELRDRAAAWAAMLERIDIERGDRVAIIAGNRVELIELLLGCAWMGAVAVPLATTIRGAQLTHVLRNSGARALIIETEHLDALARVPPPPTLERIWLLDRERPHRAHGYRCEPLPPLEELAPAMAVSPGDAAAILYSAGTTGVPRGVCCPHAQLYWWGVINSEFLAVGPDDICFTTLPLAHHMALSALCQALVAGAGYVIGPRFSSARYWHLARLHGATRTYLSAPMVTALLEQPESADDDAHRVRIALAATRGTAPSASFVRRFGVRLLDDYHSPETNHLLGGGRDEPRPQGALGRAVDDFEVVVLDANDAPLGDGEPGELAVRPRHPFSVASGYFGMPAQTLAAWRNLWFHTGERVVRDGDGWFRLVAPTPDAISRLGESVPLVEVERVLQDHPAVAAVAVFRAPGHVKDDLMAAVVPEPGADLDPFELIQFCEPRIARFAIPRYVEFITALPLTELGAVRTAELRERGIGPTTWDRERMSPQLIR